MSAPRIDELPETIPVFPLTGAILLPGGDLPLNIFEPRYLSMVSDAMAGAGIVGMVQPSNPESAVHEPPIYGIGCAGRIDAFKETDDGRFIINLAGVCRFSVVREIERATLYRQVTAAYGDFRADVEGVGSDDLDRDRILRALHAYLEAKELSADWNTIQQLRVDKLVTSLAMLCPFAPSEKQALLEAPSPAERGRVMATLMEMAALGPDEEAPLQ